MEPAEPERKYRTIEEFNRWLTDDPKALAQVESQPERFTVGGACITAHDLAKMRAFVEAARREQEALRVEEESRRKLVAAMEEICAAGMKVSREEVESLDLHRCDEMIDAALGLPEPERSRMMPNLVALRARLRGEEP